MGFGEFSEVQMLSEKEGHSGSGCLSGSLWWASWMTECLGQWPQIWGVLKEGLPDMQSYLEWDGVL